MAPELLLTGGTGFVGYYLAHALAAAGRPFVALVRPAADIRHLRELSPWCTLVEGDLLDPLSLFDALDGIPTVVHAAALVSFEDQREEEMLAVNGTGTANLVNMMIQAGARRLVHLSSVAVLNRVDGGKAVTVADRWPLKRPDTAYARSKFAAEREVWRGQAEGLSVAALYPATVLGAGDWSGPNTPGLWRRVDEGLRIHPAGTAGFVDVRDVARAVLTVLDRNVDRDRFLLSAGDMAWKTFFALVAESVGVPGPSLGLSRWQSALLWPLSGLAARLTGRPASLTRANHRVAQSAYRYDGTAYSIATGQDYRPLDVTIKETGQAYRMSKSAGAGLPPTFLPLTDVAR